MSHYTAFNIDTPKSNCAICLSRKIIYSEGSPHVLVLCPSCRITYIATIENNSCTAIGLWVDKGLLVYNIRECQ